MTRKRKKQVRVDNHGTVLKTGEGMRKNGTYYYRYKNINKEYTSVYAKTLEELREKEAVIQRNLADGINYEAGKMTVLMLVEQYVNQKTGVRYNTKKNYHFVLNLLKDDIFGNQQIMNIKTPVAKQWYIQLSQKYSYNTIAAIHGIIRPAFDTAVEYDAIRKNPFSFKLGGLITNDTQKREALTEEEQQRLLNFMREDNIAARYYNEVLILLQTGLRISELYGLTLSDIDYQKCCIRVNKQLQRTTNCSYYIETTKTECGTRCIPMTNEVIKAFQETIKNRHTNVEKLICGYSEFIFLDKDNNPKVAGHLEHAMKRFIDKYNASHPDQKLKVTPHVLRHTFCTNMVRLGMPIKDLQHIMGHEDIATTLGIYTHSNFETAAKSFFQAIAQ